MDTHQDKLLDSFKLVVERKQTKHAEQEFFTLSLKSPRDKISSPVLRGIYSKGWKYGHIKPWADLEFFDAVTFPPKDAHVVSRTGMDVRVFEELGKILPEDSSLMIAYQMLRKREYAHKITDILLKNGFPAASTPLGRLLVHAGCYNFVESGHEGPQKIKGFKPKKREKKEKKKALLKELKAFLRTKNEERDFEATARDNAKKIIEFLET